MTRSSRLRWFAALAACFLAVAAGVAIATVRL
jgi:hypothetical protein